MWWLFSPSVISNSAAPWNAACQASLSIISQSFLKLKSIKLVMPSNHLIFCCPFSSCLQSFPASGSFPVSQCFTSGGQNTGASAVEVHGVPNSPTRLSNFHFSALASSEYWGLISFRMDWFNLLAVQGTLKSLLQHHSSKASILWCSDFFTVQLSHPYMTTGKTLALTTWTFVDKILSLLFNTLSRFVIAFLPRSMHLLISWLQSRSTVILESKKIKSVTICTVSPTICPAVMGPDHDLHFLNAEF